MEGELISTEEEFKPALEDWKKKQGRVNVSIPEEKEERNQTRRDNTRRSQTKGGARFNQEDRDLYLPSDSEYDYIGDDKHQYESLKAGTKVREAC